MADIEKFKALSKAANDALISANESLRRSLLHWKQLIEDEQRFENQRFRTWQ